MKISHIIQFTANVYTRTGVLSLGICQLKNPLRILIQLYFHHL